MPQIKGVFLCVILASMALSPLRAANACETQSMAVLADFTTDKVCMLGTDQLSGMAGEWQRVRTKVCGTPASQYRGPGDALAELQKMQKQSCDAQKGTRAGALPPFEAALYAMTDARRLDPCSYDPKADNNAILNNPMYFDFNNQSSYNNGISFRRFELYIERADKAQAACFLALIRSRLTGTVLNPPAVTPQPTPVSATPIQVSPGNSATPSATTSLTPQRATVAPPATASSARPAIASVTTARPTTASPTTTSPPSPAVAPAPLTTAPGVPSTTAPPSVPATTPATPLTGALVELQERYVTVSARAKEAKANLASLEARMTAQHLSLRSDIRETRSRLDSVLLTAMEALSNRDGDKAQEYLRYSENAVATIEKFLGK